MPIRINLKEIFPSDPQEINVEKVNFNFNKLLELGIGTPGPIGLTGPQGPAGPIGLTGPQGIRGATWWVDSGIPSTHVFPGLLDGDLYLDNTSFDVWRWDATTSTWTLEVGISSIINTYLAANGSPFVKQLKSLPSTNIDSRFITFANRNIVNDLTRGAANSSTNNSLFLTNFDESNTSFVLPLNWPSNINALYNSIVSIFVDHSDNQISSAAELGRYHLELGSLYNDSINTQISDINHNLKIKYVKSFNSGPQVGLWNEWINTANFSVSVQEGQPQANILQNGIFNFITPKFNDNLSPFPAVIVPVQDELYTRVGPWESHAEISNLANIVADGISFELFYSSLAANIGIAQTYVSSYTRLNGKDLFMLDTHNLLGILLDDNTYIIGNTNVIGKVSIGDIDPISYLTVSGNASIGSGYNAILAPTNGAIIQGTVGIGTSAPLSKLSVSGNASIGSSYTTSIAPTNGAIIEGTVGIGTSSPVSKLTLSGNASIGSGYNAILAPTNGAIIEGTVGIGTSAPLSKLSVSGNTSVGSGYTTSIAPTNGAIIEGTVGIGTSAPLSKLSVSGNTSVGSGYVTNTAPTNGSIIQGTVGIGTSAPLSKLSVSGNTSIGAGYVTNTAPTNGAIIEGTVGIGTSSPTSDLTVSGNTSIGSGYTAIAAPTDGAIIEGNLGVGTSSPAAKVHIVNGNQQIELATGTSTSGYTLSVGVNDDGVNFSNTSLGRSFNFNIGNDLPKTTGIAQTKSLRLKSSIGTSTVLDMGIYNTFGQTWIQSTDSSDLSINYPLLINPNGGTVGIGTTFTDPQSKLHIAGKVKITGGSPGTDKVLTSDTTGLARWEDLSNLGLSGSGTLNRIAMFTGTGVTIGDSRIYQQTTEILIKTGLEVDDATRLKDTLAVTNTTTTKDLHVTNDTVLDNRTTFKGGLYSDFNNTWKPSNAVQYHNVGTAGEVLLSGRSTYSTPTGDCDFHWTIVGSVVTVHGTFYPALSSGIRGYTNFYLPVVPTGSGSISLISGVGSRTNGDGQGMDTRPIIGGGTNTAVLYSDGSDTYLGRDYYCSFGYIIT